MTNFPATFSDDLVEQISLVSEFEHWMSEVCVAVHLRVSERVLVGHHHFKIVPLDVLIFV